MTTATVETRRDRESVPERTRTGQVFSPAVDIIELPDELLVLADVPGSSANEIDVRFEQGELTITASVQRRQPDGTRFLAREYGVGDYYRAFRIGEAVDSDRIHAEVTDGVLKLHLPKSEHAKPRKIAVQGGCGAGTVSEPRP